MGTDFFDDDLSAPETAREQPEGKAAAGARQAEAGASRLVKQKEELAENVAARADEIERLRMRQEELEREKSELEGLAKKQDEYLRGKRDVIEKLERSVVLIEKEEAQATRMAELLSVMRTRFRDTLAEIKQINEEQWPEEEFNNEINKAAALIEEARQLHKKGIAKIEATRWQEGEAGKAPAFALDRMQAGAGGEGGFGFWLRAGLAFSLPLGILIVVLFLIYLVMPRAV
jgi:hypothetical protein